VSGYRRHQRRIVLTVMQRTIIIGDIHGCHDELLALFDVAAVASDDLVVSVGDLVDRGPQPAEVVAWFRAREGSVVLMGNHERKHVRQVFSFSQEITRVQFGAAYAEAVEWMRGLPYYYETPEVRVVHAAMMPGVPLGEQRDEVLCGSTAGEAILRAAIPDGWWHERYDDAIPVVFGHHVTGHEPLVREGKIYGIDTGACHGKRLTALSVPDFTLYSVPSRGDHWHDVMQRCQVPVLQTRPWSTMSWRKLDETIAEHADGASPDTAAYLASLTAWAASLRAVIVQMPARIASLAAELRASGDFATAAEAHPAKRLLFMHARNRLDAAAVAARCSSPGHTIVLARALGMATESTQDWRG
jgi:serine/threonine protein phosphatase 1